MFILREQTYFSSSKKRWKPFFRTIKSSETIINKFSLQISFVLLRLLQLLMASNIYIYVVLQSNNIMDSKTWIIQLLPSEYLYLPDTLYSQFHNTLPRYCLQIHWISVRFYEMGNTSIAKVHTIHMFILNTVMCA